MRPAALRLASLALAASVSVFAAGCDSGAAAGPELSIKLDGNYVQGLTPIAQYVPGTTNWVRLSRGEMTVALGFAAEPVTGTFDLADMATEKAPATGTAYVGVFQRFDAAVSPGATTHTVRAGTVTLSSVTATTVAGTFNATMVAPSGGTHTLTGRFRVQR